MPYLGVGVISSRAFAALLLLAVVTGCGGDDTEASSASSRDSVGADETYEKPPGVLEYTFRECTAPDQVDWKAYGSQAPAVEDVVSLSEDGNRIDITTPRSQGEDLGNLGWHIANCVLFVESAPKQVRDALVKYNLSGNYALHKEQFVNGVGTANISFEWYDHRSDRGSQFEATFVAERIE